jgi:hypothetical protein
MKKLLPFFLLALSVGGASGATVKTVSEAEVSAAVSSLPPGYERGGFIDRVGKESVGYWISAARTVGKVLFADGFEDGIDFTRWDGEFGDSLKAHRSFEGRLCVELVPPQEKGWAILRLADGAWVDFDASQPCAVLWEALSPEGGAPMLRIDYRDAEGNALKPSFQVSSSLNPTQPTIFQRNAALVNSRAPKGAAKFRIYFHVASRASGAKSAYIANVKVVDYSRRLEEASAGESAALKSRSGAGKDEVLVYAAEGVCASYPVSPLRAFLPGFSAARLELRECPGETSVSSVALWSKSRHDDIRLEFSGLENAAGDKIGASSFSAKVVKCHYQAAGAPDGFLAKSGEPVLVPELLLNDDTLVIADHGRKRNLLKCGSGDKTWYVDTSTLQVPKWNYPVPVGLMPVADAKTLRPFPLEAGINKQLVMRISVPADAPAGIYKGKVVFSAAGKKVAELPVSLEVLPFALPPRAETTYDATRDYTMGLYVWARLSEDGAPYLSPMHRSREQLLAEYRMLVANGVTLPAFIWGRSIVDDEKSFREHLSLVREAGFPGKTLCLAASDLLGNATEAEKLEKLKDDVRRWRALAREYGFEELYCYGLDEAKGDKLLSQRAAWQAAKEAGAKVFVSGYRGHFAAVGDILDLCIFAEAPERANPREWHKNGARLWKYNSPQTGPEDPMIFRRNYGLALWRAGYDGGCTYCDVGGGAYWNDLADLQRRQREGRSRGMAYRSHTIVYPTADGAIETLALIGLGEAIKDVRYVTRFLECYRRRKDPAAKAWFRNTDFASEDPAKIRRETIDWILRMR